MTQFGKVISLTFHVGLRHKHSQVHYNIIGGTNIHVTGTNQSTNYLAHGDKKESLYAIHWINACENIKIKMLWKTMFASKLKLTVEDGFASWSKQ